MRIEDLSPNLSNRVQFRLSEALRVPDSSGCYALTNIYDEVIYIGQSLNLNQRMQQHLDTSRMTKTTSVGLAVWFYFGLLPPEKIKGIELQLIFNYKAVEGNLPPLNRRGP
ncbi:MAG: GIY-YIG nuclease family protein [Caldilineaceae bacterium]|nr:GIY-YIG nuclease family protein [Caldilineaceae bacterium]